MAKDNNKSISLPQIKELEKYCDLVKEKKISELEIETNDIRLKIISDNKSNIITQSLNSVKNEEIHNLEFKDTTVENHSLSDVQGETVKSPMVGTVYLSPEPNAEKFVKKGDKVTKGQTLLIVEAMKVMNNISSPKSGIVEEVYVEDAQPIEYDQPLIVIK